MTYCVAMHVKDGLLFASDTRTNAGVDHLGTFKKMHVFAKEGERTIVVLSAGNLGTTQSVISILEHRINQGLMPNPLTLTSLYDIAALFGQTLKEVQARDTAGQSSGFVDFSATLIVGGQIFGEQPRLFLVYPQGNFIETSEDNCFFQIGEAKYGKPILDRVIHYGSVLDEAAKCVLVSFDSTLRSNLSVGMPIDMLWLKPNDLNPSKVRRFERDDTYFAELSRAWSEGLREVFYRMPDIP